MGYTDNRPAPLANLASADLNVRRYSMPATPPETPAGYIFGAQAQAMAQVQSQGHAPRPSLSTHGLTRRASSISSFSAVSPPVTPTRASSYQQLPPPPSYSHVSSNGLLPSHHGKGKHHRRISTATVIKALAAQGRLPSQAGGIIVTPSKVASWIVILSCTAYLGSFVRLPSPVDVIRGTPYAAHPSAIVKTAVGDSEARWAHEMQYNVPGHQAASVPAHQIHLGPDGYDSNVLLAHPEIFQEDKQQPARRLKKKPMRQATGERDAKVHAAVLAALADDGAEQRNAAPVNANAGRVSHSLDDELVPASAPRRMIPGRGQRAVNKIQRVQKPKELPSFGALDSSVAAAAAAQVEEEVVKPVAAIPAHNQLKKKGRKARKQEKELAKHAAHALARAAERRAERQRAAAVVDWSLDGDADEGDE